MGCSIWDTIVVDCLHEKLGVVEDYIDLLPMLDNLYFNAKKFLAPIKKSGGALWLMFKKLADAAEVIVQGYAFIDRGEGVTVINLHKPDHAAYFYNHELVETNMDDIERIKSTSFIRLM